MHIYSSKKHFFLVIFWCLINNCTGTEWFTSLGQMEDLIHDEKNLIQTLNEYINIETQRLNELKLIADKFQSISQYAKHNLDLYLAHPVNQFTLIKRLVYGWEDVKSKVAKDAPREFISLLKEKKLKFPNETDIQGSAEAIMRLQHTYKLNTHLLALGYVKGFQSTQSLTSDDCYLIGRTAYLKQDFYHCNLWMREVLLRKEDTYISFTLFEVLDHLSFCAARLGNTMYAYELTYQMIQLNPTNDRIVNNYHHFRNLLSRNRKGDDETGEGLSRNAPLDRRDFFNVYEALCRKNKTNQQLPKSIEKKLKCYYWTNHGDPQLILNPLKMEELYHSPHIVRFYDFVNEEEIAEIMRLAKPRLKRATIKNPFTGELETAQYRISKSTWLDNKDGTYISKVNQRISYATGLSMESAEDLQVANYGVGGQYEPHWDFAREGDPGQFNPKVGNRIATMLIYLTDVPLGGYTVFLQPEIASQPIKGSAVFWYNLYPNGKGDLRTRHAACPVLGGIKWVSNKWIHERDQEFIRQCRGINTDNRIF